MKMLDFEIAQMNKVLKFLDGISQILVGDIQKITKGEDYGLYAAYTKAQLDLGEFVIHVPSYRIDFFPKSGPTYPLGIKKTFGRLSQWIYKGHEIGYR